MKNIFRARNLFLLAVLILTGCSSSGTKTCVYPGLTYGTTYSYLYEYDGETRYGEFTPALNGDGEVTNVPIDVNCADTNVDQMVMAYVV
jgi:hypothetical protein